MATIVELVGTPGSGKSTLATALIGRRIGGRPVIGGDELLRSGGSGIVSRGARLVRALRDGSSARPGPDAALEDWAATRTSLLELIGERPLGTDVPDPDTVTAQLRRLRAPAWLLATLELHALAAAAPRDAVVVLHEGLLQRTGIVCGSDPGAALLDDYVARCCEASPEVELVVHLVCTPGRCAERVRAREATGVVNRRHVGLDDAALADDLAMQGVLLDRAVDAARRHGRHVLEVRTEAAAPASVAESVAASLRGDGRATGDPQSG